MCIFKFSLDDTLGIPMGRRAVELQSNRSCNRGLKSQRRTKTAKARRVA